MRKRWIRGIVGTLATVAVIVLSWCGGLYFRENYIALAGTYYRRDVQSMDLSGRQIPDIAALAPFGELKQLDLRGTGISVEDYEWLHQQLPGCEIRWELPFQGSFYPTDTRIICLDSLTDAEILLLDYLPDLIHVEALDCTDYAQLAALVARRPECSVIYRVSFGDAVFFNDAEKLELADVTAQELAKKLPLLPGVRAVTLRGDLPEAETLEALQAAFPEIAFNWTLTVGDTPLKKDTTALDLSGQSITLAEASEMLDYFPGMQTVDMRGCQLTDEEMMTLADRYPDCDFLWEMTVFSKKYPTDTEEIDLSGLRIADPAQVEAFLPYFYNLKKVIMCNCGLSNEQMDILDCSHSGVRFVWNVAVGSIALRTDAEYFMPVKLGRRVTDRDLYNLRYCRDMICVDIGHMWVTNCEWAAFMPHLKYLIMADTPLQDISPLEGLEELVFLELFLTKVTDVTPLRTCTALEDLNLCYVHADPQAISNMTWLKRLWWSGNGGAAAALRETLPQTRVETGTYSSTGSGWREGKRYYEMRDILGMRYMTG